MHVSTHPLHFGAFEFQPATSELRKHGMRVRLQPQAYQALALLLETPGQIRTRLELKQKLWPASTFGDFDHCLNKCIHTIRTALGDSPGDARFIETVAGQGYRFIGITSRRTEQDHRNSKEFWKRPPLAVIPFAVQGTEPELRFLSGQIASLIIDAFSQISGMKVLAYVEVRAEAAYADGIRALGSRLGVRRMIVGELTCHNGDLHLRAELVDSVNGTQLWGMHTTCALGNGIHCAAEIAGEIVSQVLATQHLSRQRRIPVNAPPDFRGSAQVSRMNIDRKPLASSLPGPAASRIPAQSQEGVPLPRFSNEDEADSA